MPQIENCLKQGQTQILLAGKSRMENLLALCAECITADKPEMWRLASRCVIAESIGALRMEPYEGEQMIWIPAFPVCATDRLPVGLTMIVPVDASDLLMKFPREPMATVQVPERNRGEFAGALQTMGCDWGTAFQLTGAVHGDFSALIRKISTDIALKQPVWAGHADVEILLPALLAGAWEENREGDRLVLERLAGEPYETYKTKLQPFLRGEHAPLFHKGSLYAGVSMEELWMILGGQVTADLLGKAVQCMTAIFSSEEMQEERGNIAGSAGMWSDDSAYSPVLKGGITKSLVYWCLENSEKEEDKHIVCDEAVRNLLSHIRSAGQWKKIADFLPVLVEASPEAVLTALEQAVREKQSGFWALWQPASNFLMRTYYPGVIQTLEKAVWMRKFAGRALLILAELTETEENGEAHDEAIRILYEIFCLWHPQGALQEEERRCLLESWIDGNPRLRRELIPRLLKRGFQSCGGVCLPAWRNVENRESRTAGRWNAELWKSLACRYLDHIEPCCEDWEPVFVFDSGFPMEAAVKKFAAQMPQMEIADQVQMKQLLFTYLRRECEFPNAAWRQSEACLAQTEIVYNTLLQDSPLQYVPCFMRGFREIHAVQTSDAEALKQQMDDAARIQRQSMTQLLQDYGKEGILALLPWVEDEAAFAEAMVSVLAQCEEVDWNLLEQVWAAAPETARFMLRQWYRAKREQLAASLLRQRNESFRRWGISCLPLTTEMVQYMEENTSAEVQDDFWKTVVIDPRDMRDQAFAEDCIGRLIRYRRAVDVIRNELFLWCPEPDLIAEALERACGELADYTSQVQLNILPLFEKLYKSSAIPSERIAALEWAYLLCMPPDWEPRCLVSRILREPEVYIQLLSYAFKNDKGSCREEAENSGMASRAYRALSLIHRIPGYDEQKKVMHEERFWQWVSKAGHLAEENGYTQAHFCALGKILSYAPGGRDGIWPVECVRQFLQQEVSENLENNMVCERANQRGVCSPTGGKEEKNIAKAYEMQAEKLGVLWPRAARVLERLDESYRWEARIDAEAEWERG